MVGPGSGAKTKEIEKKAHPNKKHLHHPVDHPSQYKEDPQGHYQSRGASGHAFYGKMKMLYPGTAAMLDEYNRNMDEVAIKDWGIFEFIPRVGEVILAAKFLGNWIDQVGEEWRAARAYRFSIAEDTGIAP